MWHVGMIKSKTWLELKCRLGTSRNKATKFHIVFTEDFHDTRNSITRNSNGITGVMSLTWIKITLLSAPVPTELIYTAPVYGVRTANIQVNTGISQSRFHLQANVIHSSHLHLTQVVHILFYRLLYKMKCEHRVHHSCAAPTGTEGKNLPVCRFSTKRAIQ